LGGDHTHRAPPTDQGNDTFWDFSIKVQTKNRLLINTTSHLNNEQLHHHMESGMNPKLALHCRLEKASVAKNNVALTLAEWLEDIKRVDGLIRSEEAHFHEFASKAHKNTRQLNALAEPSRRTNSSSMTYPNTMNASNAATSSSSRPALPKLTSTERQLLYDNEGCVKCRRVYVTHHSTNCPNDFPQPSTYKTLTQSFVDLIKKHMNKPIAAVLDMDNSIPTIPSITAAVRNTT
jgi:hypothetical protein